MKILMLFLLICSVVSGCAVGHQPWVEHMNKSVGKKAIILDPTRFGDSGELIRADFLVSGEGFTHTTTDKHGNIIQHWDISEVLPVFAKREPSWKSGAKEWVGKCKVYYIVDPKTHIVKGWNFDEGGNPLSCRIWP